MFKKEQNVPKTDTFKDEIASYNYLKKYNFQKTLKKLNKELKNKSVVIYGAGAFFQAIKKYYDLSNLNILGVCDIRFNNHLENETFLDYKVFSLDELKNLDPDYVLVATKFYINIVENLYYENFENSKTKVKALLKKPFFTLLKEIWS